MLFSVQMMGTKHLLFMVLVLLSSTEAVLHISKVSPFSANSTQNAVTEDVLNRNYNKHWDKRSTTEGDVGQLLPSQCPPWFVLEQRLNGSYICNCADSLREAVRCDEVEQRSYLAVGYCMTFDNTTGSVYSGTCPYNFFIVDVKGLWVPLPQNVSELNEYLCGALNREGTLCGHCKEGYGLSVYSQDLRCSSCRQPNGWAWYLFTEFLLQTIFFLIVIIFRVSVTTAKLSAFVLYSQILASTSASLLFPQILASYNSMAIVQLTRVGLSFYDIWNLEFFTTIIPTSCLYEQFTTLNAIALRYVSAFYPLVLIGMTYTCIELHDRNFRPIVWMWKPLHKCKVKFKKFCDLQQSVIHAFATFLLLSYTKVADVSYSLLAPSELYNVSGERIGPSVWYYDASIEMFSSEHFPYAILAVVILSTYIALPPILLFLYPFKIFRKCLRKCRLNCNVLHTFIDAFQGCYKDGTKGTYDCRYFSAFYFLIRICFISIRLALSYGLHWATVAILFALAAILLASFRPYKRTFYNIIDVLFLSLLALQFQLYNMIVTRDSLTFRFSKVLFGLLSVLGFLPLMYFIAIAIYHVFSSIRLCKRCECIKRKWSSLQQYCAQRKRLRSRQCFKQLPEERELPDRLVHPELYESLVEERLENSGSG